MLIITRTIQTIKHASKGAEGPCPECNDNVFQHPWCAGWSRPKPDKHPKETLANHSRAILRRPTNRAQPVRIENRRIPSEPDNLVKPGIDCGCQPTSEVRLKIDADGKHHVQRVRVHNPTACTFSQHDSRTNKSTRRPANTSGQPENRHPSLPPPLHPYQYHRLLKRGAQLVLAIYRPEDNAKVPVSKNWQKLRPDFPAVLHHVQSDPNALVGIIPASIGCLVVDVDHGDAVHFTTAHPPVAHAPTRRKGGRHLYYQVPPGNGPTPTGYSIDLTSQHGIRGDVRCRDSFAVIWRPSAIKGLLKVASLNSKGMFTAPAPMGQLRTAQTPGTGSGFCSYDPAQKKYWGHWWSQASASVRRDRLIKNVRLARQLHRKGASITTLANTFKRSIPTIYRWLDPRLDLKQIPPPWKLMTQRWAQARRHLIATSNTPDAQPPPVGRENPFYEPQGNQSNQHQPKTNHQSSPSATTSTKRDNEHDSRSNPQQGPAVKPRHQTLGTSTKRRKLRTSQGTPSKRPSSGLKPCAD